jgi:ABC-2 type transport system permease protein
MRGSARRPLGLAEAVWGETLKLRRSKIGPVSLLAALVIPLVLGLFMKVLVDPLWAERFGLVTLKAQAIGTSADWSGFFSMLTQAISVGGLMIFGVLGAWLFGREFSDGTMKDLLALPVGRSVVVGAKFLVLGFWCSALAIGVWAEAIAIGGLLGIPGWSGSLLFHAAGRFFAAAALTLVLCTTFGFAATAGRGYLAAVGTLFAVLFCAQILAALGLGPWFPFSVPALMSGVAGSAGTPIGPLSYLIVVATGAAAVGATMMWWHRVDQA